MRRLKLLRLASFNGFGIAVTRDSPVVEVADGVAGKLLATGYFEDLTPVSVESIEEPPRWQEAPKRKGGRRK